MLIVGRINFKVLFIFISLLFLPLFSRAQVINEIMYDPQDADDKREWVEIYNSTSSIIDLSNWKFLESVSASNHGLSLVQGNTNLLPGEYALIVLDLSKFQSSWSFGGTILRVSGVTALNNGGSNLILKNSGGIEINHYEYNSGQGASGDGNSLQLQTDGTWISAIPTPGAVNATSAYIPPGATSTTTDSTATTTTQTTTTNTTSTNTDTTLSAHYSSAGLSAVELISKFEIGAGRARLGMVGTPIEFRPEMKYSYSGNMTFKWSFGDGAIGYGQVLSHSYAYPGDYVVVLNVSSLGGQAISRTNVKIVPAEISISLASAERVEVSNNSKTEINLFGRALSSQGHSFVFPEDTIIKAGQKISFASSITVLNPFSQNDVSMIVVGDSLNKAFVPAVLISENKPDDKDKKQQIEILYAKAKEIQKQLATITPDPELHLAVRQPSDSNVATAFLSLNSNSTSTATTTKTFHEGWIQTIKEFFLGRRQ